MAIFHGCVSHYQRVNIGDGDWPVKTYDPISGDLSIWRMDANISRSMDMVGRMVADPPSACKSDSYDIDDDVALSECLKPTRLFFENVENIGVHSPWRGKSMEIPHSEPWVYGLWLLPYTAAEYPDEITHHI